MPADQAARWGGQVTTGRQRTLSRAGGLLAVAGMSVTIAALIG
jgi:hypothetical protein